MLRKEHADTAVYLAGGTDDLRLNGSAQGKDLIDINGLGFDDIFARDGKLYIGARCTLNQIIDSELVPAFIKEAAHFCASFVKRNSATVGGNIGLRRQDSYLALCRESWLPEDMKTGLADLICRRMAEMQ